MGINNCHIRPFIPYLDDGRKLYFTILHSDTLTVDGAMIFISYAISYNTSAIFALCDT